MSSSINHLPHSSLSQNNHGHNISEGINSTPQKNLGKHHTHNGTASAEKTPISHSTSSTKFNTGQKNPAAVIGMQKQLGSDKLLSGLDSRPGTPKEKDSVLGLGLIPKSAEGALSINKHKTPTSSGSAKKNNNKKARHR